MVMFWVVIDGEHDDDMLVMTMLTVLHRPFHGCDGEVFVWDMVMNHDHESCRGR